MRNYEDIDRDLDTVKLKIPNFQGKNDPEVYLEGVKKVDWIFNYHNYSEEKNLKDYMDSMKQHISGADRRRFNMSKEEKQRLRVSNIYDHNASMR
jgi:esterase/lipase